MEKKKVLARVSRIARVKKVTLTGSQLVDLAEFYLTKPNAEKLLVQAANLSSKRGVSVDGDDWLALAKFLV